MATQLNIYDYTTTDPYWGFEEQFVIGYGDLTAEAINTKIDAAQDDLDIHINSQGGKVFDGWAIYNKLKAYDRGKVTIYIDGIAASIASIIAMAGETVIMPQASMMMIHKPTGFYLGSMNSDELASEAQSLTEIEAVLIDVYASKTGLSSTKLQNLLDAATWLSPDSALALGFCDEVQKTATKQTIMQNTFDRLFTNASESTRIYANSAFAIKQNKDMSTPAEEIKIMREEQTGFIAWCKDVLGFKNQAEQTQEDEPKENEISEDETTEQVETPEAKIARLEQELAAEKAEKVDAMNAVNEVRAMMLDIKSNYKAPEKAPEFNNSKAKGGETSRFSHLQNN